MSLDIDLMGRAPIYSANITHNLAKMAEAAGIYDCLWGAKKQGFEFASQLIVPLSKAIKDMEADPEKYKAYDSQNGWGKYEDFLPWIKKLLAACDENPEAEIEVSV